MTTPSRPTAFFFGTPSFSSIILESLIAGGFVSITNVVTRREKPQGRHMKEQASPVRSVADRNTIPVFFDTKMADVVELVRQRKPDIIIVAAYGRILPSELLGSPRYGCINVHPSLLPLYRGPSPIQAVLMAGEIETGTTLIKMNERMDEGDIIAQEACAIDQKDTGETLGQRLATLSAHLLSSTLPLYTRNEIKPRAQDGTLATYCSLVKKEDGKIDWSLTPAAIQRKIYALYPWPCAWSVIKGVFYKFLPGNKIQPAGKRVMTFEEFKRGNGNFTLPKQIFW